MKINLVLLFLFTICVVTASFAQNEVKISKLDNLRLIKVLNSSELIAENIKQGLSVKVYRVNNGTGSAGFPNSEVSHNILIAVSEMDEEPDQNLFEIGPFYNPEFIKWTGGKESQKEFEIEYGVYQSRKSIKLKINIDELKLE